MKKHHLELHEPDTVFGTGGFSDQDIAARQEYIAKSRGKSENKLAVKALADKGIRIVRTPAQESTKTKRLLLATTV